MKILTTLVMLFSLTVLSQNDKENKTKITQDSLHKIRALKDYNDNLNAYQSMGIFSHVDLYTHQNVNILSSIADLNDGMDTDGDGIENDIDIDDDNDGILDTDEGLASNAGNNLLLNGTFDGPNNNSFTVPANWEWIPFNSPICEATSPNNPNSASPNITDIFGPSITSGIYGTPQDGTTFMSALHTNSSGSGLIFHEGMRQTVSLTAGVTYTMTFYQSNVGQSNSTDGTGVWRIFIDNQEIFESESTIPNSIWSNINLTWTFQSFSFIPTTSGSQVIQFLPFDDDPNISTPNGVRLGIDNVVLTAGTTVINEDIDGDTIANNLDLDSDNDGISDLQESGLDVTVYDPDHNGVIDGENFVDNDNDGLADALEVQFGADMSISPEESLADADTIPNFIDLDSDGDTIPDSVEAQLTLGYDSIFSNDGNVTDDDADGDGIIDVYDSFIGHGGNFNVVQNTDATDLPDYLDSDSDNDSLSDIMEVGNSGLDTNLDGATDTDEGVNGFDNSLEASDNFEDPDGPIDNPSLLPDIDGDVLMGGDVDYRDVLLFAEILDTTTICAGSDGIILFNGTPNASVIFTLNNGAVQTIILDSTGTGAITVTSPSSDITIELVSVTLLINSEVLGTLFILEIIDLPIIDLGDDIVLCDGETTVLDASTPNGSYVWQDGSTGATFTVTSSGTYSVEVFVDGCSSTDEIIVNYNPLPIVQLGADLTVCENETVVLDVTTENATYLWQDGSVNPTFTVGSAGTYTVELTVNGCTATDSIIINFDTLPLIDLGADINLCETETIVLDATTTNATYVWQDGSTGETFNVTSAGIYTVQVTVGTCTVEDAIEVIYNTVPEVYMFDLVQACTNIQGDGVFNLFEASSLISGNQNTVASSFYTSFSDAENDIDRILNPEAFTSQNVTIFIRLQNIVTQCFSIGNFEIETIDCEIFIPEGFSPNGDTTNETFEIINLELFPNHTLEIFNRYGMTVYNGNANKPEWDGRYQGNLLPTGTYFYVIQLNNDGSVIQNIEEDYVGWVYMIHE